MQCLAKTMYVIKKKMSGQEIKSVRFPFVSGLLPDYLTEQLFFTMLLATLLSPLHPLLRCFNYVILINYEGFGPCLGVFLSCETHLCWVYWLCVDFRYLIKSIQAYFSPMDAEFGSYVTEYRSLLRRKPKEPKRRVPWTSIPPEAKFLTLDMMEVGPGMDEICFSVEVADSKWGQYSPPKLVPYSELRERLGPNKEIGNGARVQLDMGEGLKWYVIKNDVMYIDGPNQTVYFSVSGYKAIMRQLSMFGGIKPADLGTISSAVQRVCTNNRFPEAMVPLVRSAGALVGVVYNREIIRESTIMQELHETWTFITHYNKLSGHYRNLLIKDPRNVVKMFKWITLSKEIACAFGYIFSETPVDLRDRKPEDLPNNVIQHSIPRPPSERKGKFSGLVPMLFSPFSFFYTNPIPDTTSSSNMYDALAYRLSSTPDPINPRFLNEMYKTADEMSKELTTLMLFDEWLAQTRYSRLKKESIQNVYITAKKCENAAFVKKEAYDTVKRPRAIIDAAQDYKNLEGPAVASIEPLFEDFPEILSGIPVDKWQETVTLASAAFGEDAARFSLDYSSFETCFGEETMKVESYLYNKFLKNFPEVARKMYRVQTNPRKVIVYGRKGLKFIRPPFRFSGDQRTYQANSLMNILFIRTAMRLAEIDRDAYVSFVSGDDSNITVRAEDKPRIPVFLDNLRSMGLKVKCAEGSLGESGFCGFCFDETNCSTKSRIARDPLLQGLKLLSVPKKMKPKKMISYMSGSAYCMLTQYAHDPVMRELLVPLAGNISDAQVARNISNGTYNYWQAHILGKQPIKVAELIKDKARTSWVAASNLTGYTIDQLQKMAHHFRNVSIALVMYSKNASQTNWLRAQRAYKKLHDFAMSVDAAEHAARFWYNTTHVPQLYSLSMEQAKKLPSFLSSKIVKPLVENFVNHTNATVRFIDDHRTKVWNASKAFANSTNYIMREWIADTWNASYVWMRDARGSIANWTYNRFTNATDFLNFRVDCAKSFMNSSWNCLGNFANVTGRYIGNFTMDVFGNIKKVKKVKNYIPPSKEQAASFAAWVLNRFADGLEYTINFFDSVPGRYAQFRDYANSHWVNGTKGRLWNVTKHLHRSLGWLRSGIATGFYHFERIFGAVVIERKEVVIEVDGKKQTDGLVYSLEDVPIAAKFNVEGRDGPLFLAGEDIPDL